MGQNDSGGEDEAHSKHGVLLLARVDVIQATLHERIDISQSMNVEHSGAISSTFDMLENKLQEEIASLRGNHSTKHFAMEASEYIVYEKIDAVHGPHCGTPEIMVGMKQKDRYINDKVRSERVVSLLANMEAIEATLPQEEIA